MISCSVNKLEIGDSGKFAWLHEKNWMIEESLELLLQSKDQ